jgi:hypothetical protein
VELEGTGLSAFEPGVGQSTWIVTVLDTLNFQLNGSTAPGTTTTAGYCIDYEVQPAFQIPVPGELATMRDMAPVLQGMANAIPYGYRNAGKYRLYNYYAGLLRASPAVAADPYSSSWSANAVFVPGDNFIPLSGVSLDHLLNGGISTSDGSAGGPVVVSASDVLEVEYQFSCQLVSSSPVNVTFHLAAFAGTVGNFHNIAAVTAGTPATITTGTNHGLSTGDYAGIFGNGLSGSSNVNNLHQVTVLNATQYTLNGSSVAVGSGVSGTAVSIPAGGGTVQDLRPSNWPVIAVPTIGRTDPFSVRGVLSSLIPASHAPFSPASLTWFGLYVTPVTAANLSQLNMLGPAMCTVRHLRVN